MKKALQIFLFAFCFATPWQIASATHIVGGELIYACLGNDQYQVTLKVFRDCFNGLAPFDNPAYVFVFDANGNQVNYLTLSLPPVDTLDNDPGNPCLTIPPGICVDEADYTGTITLPPSPGGYTLVYQRCCRNSIIVNLFDPGGTGQSSLAFIPDTSLAVCNSSPYFNNFPPTLICVDQDFTFDHSATDPDGDSLVYGLCAPFIGADAFNPQPTPGNPPLPPPYPLVTYNLPYSAADPMGGNPPMAIDPVTGQLTVTPGTIGNFVVGICVNEYRNGNLLEEHKRDFQFNVVQCQLQVVAAIPNVINNCSDYTVFFQNLSVGASYFHWDFGTGNPNDTSNLFQPTFTFPDTGIYTITLYANPGAPCADTTTATVYIYPTFTGGMAAPDGCEGQPVQFYDQSTATFGTIDSWDWDFGDGGSSSVQNPTHIYNSSGTYTVQLIVGTDVGCLDTITEDIVIYPSPVTNVLPSDTTICYLDFVQLNASGTGNFNWQPNYNISGLTIPNPVVGPDVTTTYYVTLSNSFGCYDVDSVTIHVFDTVLVFAGEDTTICPGQSIQLNATGGIDFSWSPTSGLSNPNISNPVATPGGTTTYFLTSSVGSCFGTDNITIFVKPFPQVFAGPDQTICEGDSVLISASGLTYYSWSPTGSLSDPTSQTPIAFPTSTTTYTVTGSDTSACFQYVEDLLTVSVLPAPQISMSPDTTIILGTCTEISVTATGNNTYQWSPTTGLDAPTSATTNACPTETTTYYVIITTEDGCQYLDSVRIIVNPEPLLIFPSAFSPNADGKNDYFRPVILGLATIDEFRIFNRWGEVVFDAGNIQVASQGAQPLTLDYSWDGDFKGKEQPVGVYIYYLAGKGTATNSIVERKGNFTLVR